MEIENIDAEMEGAKRHRFPCRLRWTCPNCGKEHTKDYSDNYISYPSWDEPVEDPLFCLDCDELEPVTHVTLVPRLDLEVRNA